jgi:GNAT superfamily N-acetyltransferase
MLAVQPFAAEHLEPAAALLAARHRRDRARFPLLPERYESPAPCADVIRDALGYSDAVAAIRRETGALAGFILGLRVLTAPNDPRARYQPPRDAMMFAHGHAVAEGDDPFEVLHALYAVLGARWIEQGVFSHTAHVPAGDPPAEHAWSDLGFGRVSAFAIRDAGPVERGGAAPPGVDVRRAAPIDLDAVLRLQDEEPRFHARAPIWRPYVQADTAAKRRAEALAELEGDEAAYFVASVEGRDIGLTWVSAGRGSPLFVPDGAAYIGEMAVVAEQRRHGTGAALLAAALGWAQERGFKRAALHFATANAVSRVFWTRHGFVPVMHHLRRHVDPRIAWARPRE